MDKKNVLVAVLAIQLFCIMSVYSDVPTGINYQGRLKKYDQPVTGPQNFTFKLYKADGPAVWAQNNPNLSVTNGMFNCVLNCSTVAWADGPYYLEVSVNGTALTPREQINASAYAFFAIATSTTYTTDSSLLNGHESGYFLDTSSATTTYLSKTDAGTTYLNISSGNTITTQFNNVLTSTISLQNQIYTIGTTTQSMSNIYLSSFTTVGNNFISNSSVAATYLSQSDATATYSTILQLSATGQALTTETNNRINGDNTIGITTGTLFTMIQSTAQYATNTYNALVTTSTAIFGSTFTAQGIIVNGNVGIGTTNPQNKLDVNGTMAIGSYAGVTTAPTGSSLIVSGNVGIGMPTASTNLEIYNSVATDGIWLPLRVKAKVGSTFGGVGIDLTAQWTDLTDFTLGRIVGIRYSAYKGGLAFFINNSGSIGYPSTTMTEAVRIDNTGKLGIGTTNPTQIFSVLDSTFVVTSLGNVGIGTTNPQYALDVTGAVNATGGFNGTVTNGVVTTGSYADPLWITSLAGSKISGNIAGNAGNVTGTVVVGNGGTGATSLTGLILGNGASAMTTITDNSSHWNIAYTSITNATPNNTGSTLVLRDGTGNFSAGTITATTFTGTGASTISGNMGIGTTGPSSLLDINGGSITVRGTNAGIIVNGDIISNQSSLNGLALSTGTLFTMIQSTAIALTTESNSVGVSTTSLGISTGTLFTMIQSTAVYMFNSTPTIQGLVVNGNIGISSSSPQGRLTIKPGSTDTYSLFVSSQDGSTGNLVVNNQGNVGMGTTNPQSNLEIINDPTTNGGGLTVSKYSNDSNPAYLMLRKAEGTLTSPAAVLANDILGQINGRGFSGSGTT